MKYQILLLPFLFFSLLSCSEKNDTKQSDLLEAVQEKHKQQDSLEIIRNELQSLIKSSGELHSDIEDLKQEKHSETRSLVSVFSNVEYKKRDAKYDEYESIRKTEVRAAREKYKKEKTLVTGENTLERRKQFKTLLEKQNERTQAIYDTYKKHRKEAEQHAKKLIQDYKTKVSNDMGKKYSTISNKEKEIESLNQTIEAKRSELSEHRTKLRELSDKIKRLKELQEAKQ